VIALRLPEALDRADALDRVAVPVFERLDAAVGDTSAAPMLQGRWLGHPLHPVLTDVPIGCWTSAWLIDVFGRPEHDDLATWFIGLGVVAAVPTALSGWASWLRLPPEMRRTGVVHAAANSVATGLYLASWRARRSGNRWRGVRLAQAGATVATAGAFLGGHLAFGTDDGPRTPGARSGRRRV
jgi:uncharacterized membrane protein